jgi:hypothetical protein
MLGGLCVLLMAVNVAAVQRPAKSKAVKTTPTAAIKAPATQPAAGASASSNTTATSGDSVKPSGEQSQQSSNGPRAGEEINWDVIASGGGPMSSVNFLLDGTLGQAVAGPSTSTNFVLNAGYWQDFGQDSYVCGDASVNGRVDISDVVFIVNYIFGSGPVPDPLAAADVNCSNRVDISDCVYLVNYIFGGGGVPCATCS